jgi:hypothetical protein
VTAAGDGLVPLDCHMAGRQQAGFRLVPLTFGEIKVLSAALSAAIESAPSAPLPKLRALLAKLDREAP